METMENNFTWNRWIKRKPEEGQPIIAVLRFPEEVRATQIIHFGDAVISLVEDFWKDVLHNIYWIELPE